MALTHDPMQPSPEMDQQLFLDGMQSVDIARVRGEVQQVRSFTQIQQVAEQLSGLISTHARNHRELLNVRQINGVDGAGVVSVILRVN